MNCPVLPVVLIGILLPLIYLIPDSSSLEGYAICGLGVLGIGVGINFLFEALGGTVESPSLLTPVEIPHRAPVEVEIDVDVEDATDADLPEALIFDSPFDYIDWLAEENPTPWSRSYSELLVPKLQS